MPSQTTANQTTKILGKLAERAAQRKANTEEQDAGMNQEVPFLRHLAHLFPIDARKKLTEAVNSDSGDNAEQRHDLRNLAELLMVSGATSVDRVPADLLNRLGRQNYTPESMDDGEQTRMSIFKAVTKNTAKDYARRLASLLAFCLFVLEDESRAEGMGIALNQTTILALKRFSDAFTANKEDINALVELLVTLSGYQYTQLEDYNVDVLCSFAIGQLYDADGGQFKSKESASKTLSAFKYSVKLAILSKVMGDPNSATSLLERVQWKRHGPNGAFKQLIILHAGVNSLYRKLKPAAMVLDSKCERISYDGIPCSFDLLNDVLHSKIEEAHEQLEHLLMDFEPVLEADQGDESLGYSSTPFTPYFALGTADDNEYGDMSLFAHVMADAELKKRFYGLRRVNAKRNASREYLNACKNYEKTILVLVHILMGCGSRATDYASMTFRNGIVEAQARTVSIYDKDYLHCTMQNRKCTLLHGKSKEFSTLLPRKLADSLLVLYWKYVRPFAAMLVDGLNNHKSFERWQRYCFVQACDEKWVRKAVRDAFGGSESRCTFQWLRHSSNFLMKMFVKGAIPNAALPVYKLFGHSEGTDACYAVEKLAGFSSESYTNTTDVRLILSTFWSKVDLENRRENPTDVVEGYEDTDDEVESSSGLETTEDSAGNEDSDDADSTISDVPNQLAVEEGTSEGDSNSGVASPQTTESPPHMDSGAEPAAVAAATNAVTSEVVQAQNSALEGPDVQGMALNGNDLHADTEFAGEDDFEDFQDECNPKSSENSARAPSKSLSSVQAELVTSTASESKALEDACAQKDNSDSKLAGKSS